MEKDNYFLKKIIAENKEKAYRKNRSKITDVSTDFKAETLYIGSKRRNSNVFLRIYDKKMEQLK